MINELEEQLGKLLEGSLPQGAASEINAAMAVAGKLEQQGFQFKLKDMNPRSLHDTQWQAVFMKDDMEYVAEHPQSAIAICSAAVGALSQEAV